MIAEQYSLFEPPKSQKLSQAERTLSMLRIAPRSTIDLFSVGPRPAAYIRQLRLMGYLIESQKVGSVAVYSLSGKIETVEVTEEMKLDYYATEHWKSIRLSRMQFDEFRCSCCGTSGELQVHHWKYDLFSEKLCDLLTVCSECHLRLHSYENVHCHFPKYISMEIAKKLNALISV